VRYNRVVTRGELDRAVGVSGAVLMGLGSILGTGIFVSVGIATGIAGPAVLIAIAIAAAVAICNGLSSAQLAASHPVSGGTYEYGYRYLSRPFGLVAGWTFLLAKSASAATAALGFAGYILAAFDVANRPLQIAIAVALVVAITAVVAGGIARTSRANAAIVGATLVGLVAFVVTNIPSIDSRHFQFDGIDPVTVLHAAALMFVAFAGYGRIATLGEEVRDPARTIPRAIVIALVATLALYAAVVVVGVGAIGAPAFAATSAPLEAAAPGSVRYVVAVAAVTAMAGVLLNLILGLSRVVLAMGRRGDLPRTLATIDARKSPRHAILVTGAAIALLALVGNVRTTWSFSAFMVLLYYAITNLAALRLPAEHRRFPRVIAALALAACIALAAFVAYAVITAWT